MVEILPAGQAFVLPSYNSFSVLPGNPPCLLELQSDILTGADIHNLLPRNVRFFHSHNIEFPVLMTQKR